MRITKTAVDRLIYEKANNKQDIRWDDKLSGFGIRVYPSGKKSFVLAYRRMNRKHIMSIGIFGNITADEARTQAKTLIAGLTLKYDDPLETRRKRMTAETVSEFCKLYIDDYAQIHKKSWKDDRNRIDSHILPAWKNTPISAITKNDVSKLHKKIGGRAVYEANRTLALIKKMFNLAIEWELLEPPVNPAIGIKPFKEIKRDRWLNPEEVSRLLKALQKEKNIYARSAFWLYLLTGLRKTELLTVKWDDIDITRAELRLPDTKSGKSHYLPLSKPAIEILSHIPKIDFIHSIQK